MSKLETQRALPRRKLFRSTEDFVRQVLTKDLKQMVSDETIRSVAMKVDRSMPKRRSFVTPTRVLAEAAMKFGEISTLPNKRKPKRKAKKAKRKP